ncbi:MAG TPA: hypothetical protein VFE42_20615 [Chloroflexota bacterium]|nr:hypothetical protein [Chloroflexota bacterium]HZS89881.1 hypothetical protein [Chloroflexota bacterium]
MANNILQARVTISGTRPLLWHAFGPDSIPLTKQEKTGVAGNDPEEWRKTVLVTPDGQLYVEPTYIFGCVRDGARHTKKGRGSIQPLVAATLQILDDRVLVDRWMPEGVPPTDPAQPVFLHVCSVRNPATKARNVRYRVAASAGWTLSFTALWDKTVVSRGELESAIRDAGALEGIGDGRRIGFGRFILTEFSILDGDKDDMDGRQAPAA